MYARGCASRGRRYNGSGHKGGKGQSVLEPTVWVSGEERPFLQSTLGVNGVKGFLFIKTWGLIEFDNIHQANEYLSDYDEQLIKKLSKTPIKGKSFLPPRSEGEIDRILLCVIINIPFSDTILQKYLPENGGKYYSAERGSTVVEFKSIEYVNRAIRLLGATRWSSIPKRGKAVSHHYHEVTPVASGVSIVRVESQNRLQYEVGQLLCDINKDVSNGNNTYIGFDTEYWRRIKGHPGTLCLIQLHIGNQDNGRTLLIDVISLKDVSLLKKIFLHPNCLFLGYSLAQDIEYLEQYEMRPSNDNIIDIQIPAGSVGGYVGLIDNELGVKRNKVQQLRNWKRRPMDEESWEYAASDVIYLYDCFKSVFERVGGDPLTFGRPKPKKKKKNLKTNQKTTAGKNPHEADGGK